MGFADSRNVLRFDTASRHTAPCRDAAQRAMAWVGAGDGKPGQDVASFGRKVQDF